MVAGLAAMVMGGRSHTHLAQATRECDRPRGPRYT